MKKFLSIILTLVLLSSMVTVNAAVGDIIGTAYHTDIVAYINNYAIPSYAVNGTSVIVAEDLRNFGFDVVWNNDARRLTIYKNEETSISEMSFSKTGIPSSKFADLLSTDISVYASGKKLTSYAINGYTMIPIEELTMYGEVYWIAEQRAIKLWIDGVNIRNSMQDISSSSIKPEYYQNTPFLSYTWVIGKEPSEVTVDDGYTTFKYNHSDEIWNCKSLVKKYLETMVANDIYIMYQDHSEEAKDKYLGSYSVVRTGSSYMFFVKIGYDGIVSVGYMDMTNILDYFEEDEMYYPDMPFYTYTYITGKEVGEVETFENGEVAYVYYYSDEKYWDESESYINTLISDGAIWVEEESWYDEKENTIYVVLEKDGYKIDLMANGRYKGIAISCYEI